jgi:hypothetical protein
VLRTQNAQNTWLNVNDVINTSVAQYNSCIYRSDMTSSATIGSVGNQQINFGETGDIFNDLNSKLWCFQLELQRRRGIFFWFFTLVRK